MPKIVIGDERRFLQILINLIKNAIKFTREKGFIEIRTKYNYDEECLTVGVKDSGVGISAEDQ